MFIDYLDRGMTVGPDMPCVVDASGSTRFTHREVAELSHRVAVALAADGIGTGSKVAVHSPNDVSALICVLGVFRAGATWVALNPKSTTDELADLLNLVKCDFLFFHDDFAKQAAEVMAKAPSVAKSVRFAGGGCDDSEWMAPEGSRAERVAAGPDDVAMIMGTSGTTGRAKAVPITNRQYLTMSLAFNAHLKEPEPPRYLLATPMTHAAGVSAWPVIAEGGCIVVHDGVDAAEIFASIGRHRVTRLFLPPTAIYTLLAHPDVRSTDFGSLRHFIYAAAPMSADKLVESMEVFGPVMTQTFGQAEAPMICTCMTPQEHLEALGNPAKRVRLKSCGRPSLVTTVAIMDDAGNLLGAHERGEIVVRGDLVMHEYWGDPEATREITRPGGWHGTGDIGYRDQDGFVYIVDRKKDLIITGGFNVYPSEVERVVWSLPAVLDCAVIGVPDAKWGEAVTAVVELKEGARLTAEEVTALCRSELGPVKTPKAVLFRSLPRSSNGKVLRRALRDEYWAGQDRLV